MNQLTTVQQRIEAVDEDERETVPTCQIAADFEGNMLVFICVWLQIAFRVPAKMKLEVE